MSSILEKAINIAVAAHHGQVDKNGAPYILHPLRVMLAGDTMDEMVVGVLHDVIEDSTITIADMAKEFPPDILHALVAITHLDNEPNSKYIHRVAGNDLATVVKIADISDNLLPWRFSYMDESTRHRLTTNYYNQLRYLRGIDMVYAKKLATGMRRRKK